MAFFCGVRNLLICFSSKLLIFCKWKSDMSKLLTVAPFLWVTWVNRSGSSFAKSTRSEWLKSLSKKEQMKKSNMSDSLWSMKKRENCKKIWKIWIFRANRSFFESDLLSHVALLKWVILSKRANSQPCFWYFSPNMYVNFFKENARNTKDFKEFLQFY